MKSKSWFASIECMDYLCDNWSLLAAVLQHVLEVLGDPRAWTRAQGLEARAYFSGLSSGAGFQV